MSTSVAILDYGLGNLFSVKRAIEFNGASAQIINNPNLVCTYDRLVIPGVGAFKDGIQGLERLNLINSIHEFSATGRPMLGICLGMQLLFTCSSEFGNMNGLNLISGSVKKIPDETNGFRKRKVPHIGWNKLVKPSSINTWKGTILDGLDENSSVYFVHSYAATQVDPAFELASCMHDNYEVCSVVQNQNVIGCQFHPEKSGPIGLNILNNFLLL